MNKKPIRANFVVRIAFTLIFIFLFVSVINLQVEMNELRKLRDEKVAQVAELQDDVDELELRIAEPINDSYIERVAREQLGFRKPHEIIFVNGIAD
ncbi:MAG: septum formation initiator family protein [Ruminococcaceae bacterium]|nr:septum formation initiator family protein [Oscillospiraceae bacterium]